MKKIFYWSPHLSRVATIKNVINSAKSIKIFNKNEINVSIIDAVGEWKKEKNQLQNSKINFIELPGLILSKFLPITGFFKTRIIFLLILITKYPYLNKLLKKEKPEYFILHLVTILPLIILLISNYKTKFILRISGLPKVTFLRKILWKKVSNKLFLITCPSEQTKIDMVQLGLFPEKKIKVLYDPILEVDLISEQLKKNYDLNIKNKKYFLNIGRLTKQKNQALLIKAFIDLIKNYQDLYLYIVGDGEEKKKLEKIIENNNLKKNVFLLGDLDNVYPLIKHSLAVVSTSIWEDPGAVMVEAAYCEKPVISSNCPNGPREFLLHGNGGYLFENNELDDLKKKLILFLEDNKNSIQKKILLSKKNSDKYTLLSHYRMLNKYLNLN